MKTLTKIHEDFKLSKSIKYDKQDTIKVVFISEVLGKNLNEIGLATDISRSTALLFCCPYLYGSGYKYSYVGMRPLSETDFDEIADIEKMIGKGNWSKNQMFVSAQVMQGNRHIIYNIQYNSAIYPANDFIKTVFQHDETRIVSMNEYMGPVPKRFIEYLKQNKFMDE